MANENLRDLNAFVVVAEECSFTRATARPSASRTLICSTGYESY